MGDRLVRGLFPDLGLRAIVLRCGDTARMARMLHGLAATSAHLFAEGLASGLLVGALQKERGRINLQVECDGPIRGLFVEADAESGVRGYVKAPAVVFPGDGERGARAALGGSGFLSVLRAQPSGEFYRSDVELLQDGLAGALRRWFRASEQVETALDLAVVARPGEPLGEVAGLLVQRLPDGEVAAVTAARAAVERGAFRDAVAAGGTPQEWLRASAGEGFELLADQEVAYRCGCSRARVRSAVSALGADGVADLLATQGQAEVDCEFCRAHYRVEAEELRDIERRLRARSLES